MTSRDSESLRKRKGVSETKPVGRGTSWRSMLPAGARPPFRNQSCLLGADVSERRLVRNRRRPFPLRKRPGGRCLASSVIELVHGEFGASGNAFGLNSSAQIVGPFKYRRAVMLLDRTEKKKKVMFLARRKHVCAIHCRVIRTIGTGNGGILPVRSMRLSLGRHVVTAAAGAIDRALPRSLLATQTLFCRKRRFINPFECRL